MTCSGTCKLYWIQGPAVPEHVSNSHDHVDDEGCVDGWLVSSLGRIRKPRRIRAQRNVGFRANPGTNSSTLRQNQVKPGSSLRLRALSALEARGEIDAIQKCALKDAILSDEEALRQRSTVDDCLDNDEDIVSSLGAYLENLVSLDNFLNYAPSKQRSSRDASDVGVVPKDKITPGQAVVKTGPVEQNAYFEPVDEHPAQVRSAELCKRPHTNLSSKVLDEIGSYPLASSGLVESRVQSPTSFIAECSSGYSTGLKLPIYGKEADTPLSWQGIELEADCGVPLTPSDAGSFSAFAADLANIQTPEETPPKSLSEFPCDPASFSSTYPSRTCPTSPDDRVVCCQPKKRTDHPGKVALEPSIVATLGHKPAAATSSYQRVPSSIKYVADCTSAPCDSLSLSSGQGSVNVVQSPLSALLPHPAECSRTQAPHPDCEAQVGTVEQICCLQRLIAQQQYANYRTVKVLARRPTMGESTQVSYQGLQEHDRSIAPCATSTMDEAGNHVVIPDQYGLVIPRNGKKEFSKSMFVKAQQYVATVRRRKNSCEHKLPITMSHVYQGWQSPIKSQCSAIALGEGKSHEGTFGAGKRKLGGVECHTSLRSYTGVEYPREEVVKSPIRTGSLSPKKRAVEDHCFAHSNDLTSGASPTRAVKCNDRKSQRRSASRFVSIMVDPTSIPQAAAESSGTVPHYDDLINFSRAKGRGAAHRCVMCGREGLAPSKSGQRYSFEEGSVVVIPTQNKDVCKTCDTAIWRFVETGAFFKWCKGCKRFHPLSSFARKLRASKCDESRARGRAGYMRRKEPAGKYRLEQEPML